MKLKSFLALSLVPFALTGCSTTQIASGIATADKYQSDVQKACMIASTSANDPAAVLLAASVPAVASAINLVKASCGTEESVASLVLSPTSVAWLGTLDTTITSKGAVVPPAPTAPTAKAS